MKNKRIKYQDFVNANQKLWMNWTRCDSYRLSNEDFERYDKIYKLYRKQNRFNIFSIFNGMYKEHLPYGRKCLNVSKILLSVYICIIAMLFFYKFMAIPMLCMMPLLMFLIFLKLHWHSKYETVKRNWDYNKKYNPNFEREQKLKRVLNQS
jgi:hypothetical protein